MKNTIIIFDFDGVIVSSCRLSLEIDKEQYDGMTFSELQSWEEGNIYSKKLREEMDDVCEMYYFEQYHKRVVELIPVEGIEEVIKELSQWGYKLIIVSSSNEESIENYLKTHNLDKYFVEIMGKNTHRSKVEKFKMIFKKYKIKPQETLIITDSVGDVKEAHEVKMKAIGVIWGIHEKERLEKNGVDFIAERPSEILVGIKKILVSCANIGYGRV
jgi:HAD superfamily hydrolase (TIGR01509 family)